MPPKDSNIFLSIVVPTINSARFIDITMQTLTEEIQHYPFRTEIIVADDCSTDGTPETLTAFSQRHPQIPFTIIRNNQHYGQSISTINGIRVSSGKYIVTFDDDLQYDVKDIRKLVDTITADNNISIVNAYRTNKTKKKIGYKITRFISVLISALLFPSYFAKNYFTSFKIMDSNIRNRYRNIYFFWEIPAKKISCIPIQTLAGIRDRTNYNLGKLIKGFYFLLIKMIQRTILLLIICCIPTYLILINNTSDAHGINIAFSIAAIILTICYFCTFIQLRYLNNNMLSKEFTVYYENSSIR